MGRRLGMGSSDRAARRAPVGVTALMLLASLAGAPAPVTAADPVATSTIVEIVTPQPIGTWQPITLAATVVPAHATSERVEFQADGLRLGNAALDAQGRAELTWMPGLSTGDHTITAGYPGSGGFGWSNSDPVLLTVVDNRAPVTVIFSTDPASTLPGELFAMDVTITPNPGAGYVAFTRLPATSMRDPVPIGADGTVHTTGWINVAGDWQLQACFLGTVEFREACSDPIPQAVHKLATTTTLSVTPEQVYPDEPFEISVDVVPAPEIPSVVYLPGLPALALDASGHGEAAYTSSPYTLPVGEHDLIATFPGTLQREPSTSAPSHLSIHKDAVTLTVDVMAGEVGDPITVSATVDPAPTWEGAGVGILAFGPAGTGRGENLGIVLGPDGSGSVTVETAHWPAGTWWYEATFGGSTRVSPAVLRGEFALEDLDPPVGRLWVGPTDGTTGSVEMVISSSVLVSWPADDGLGFGVAGACLSNDGVTWVEKDLFRPVGHWTLLPGDGPRTVYAKWIDQAGNWSETVSVTLTVDATLGYVSVPDPAPGAGDAVENGLMPLEVDFESATAEGVVTGYELQESTDGAAFQLTATWAGVTADRRVRPGHTYRYRVRALDAAGGHGAWAVQDRGVTVAGFQQSAGQIEYRGTWRSRSVAGAWGGTVRRATAKGARASIRTTSQAVAWVTRTGPRLGRASVWVNGRKVATVNLYSPTWSGPKVVWAGDWARTRARTVTVRVVGTAGHPGAEIDGFYSFR